MQDSSPTFRQPAVTDAAGPQDVVNCFQLILGRRPGNQRDIDFHLGAPIAKALHHIIGSKEFTGQVLPRLIDCLEGRDHSPKQLPLGLAKWADELFGLGIPVFTPDASLWPDILANCLGQAGFCDLLRANPRIWRSLSEQLPSLGVFPEKKSEPPAPGIASGGDRPPVESGTTVKPALAAPPAAAHAPGPAATAPAPKIDGAETSPPATRTAARQSHPHPALGTAEPSLGQVFRLLLGNDTPLPARLPIADPVTAARHILVSPEFATRVLGPLAAGHVAPQTDPVPTELREFAAQSFLGGKLAFGASHFHEARPRFLLRLLMHADSQLRPDPAAWSKTGLSASAVERLRSLRDAAVAALAAQDPLLRAPCFAAAAQSLGADALFRYVLGRPPSARDRLVDWTRRGYPAALLKLLLAPEFERAGLGPLRAGKPLRHTANAQLGEDHVEVLHDILRRRPEPPADWSRDLALTLGDPLLLDALAAVPADQDQAEAKDYVLGALRRIGAEARQPPRIPVLVELRDDRRLVFSTPNAAERRGQRLQVRLALVASQRAENDGPPDARFAAEPRIELSIQMEPAAGGQLEAVVTLPALSFKPHVWSGTATCHLRDEGDQEESQIGSPIPLRVAFAAPVLTKLQTKLEEEAKRAAFMAKAGRVREALALLDRLNVDAPGFAEGRILAATITAATGNLEGAAQLLQSEILSDSPGAAELRARLALRQGRLDEAAAGFAAAARPNGVIGRALALLAAASDPGGPPVSAGRAGSLLLHEALRLLRAPQRSALPLAVAFDAAADDPERTGLAREVAVALALIFAPGLGTGEFLRELDARGILRVGEFLQDPEVRELRLLLLPALGHVAPARIADADLLVAVARILEAEGRAEEALTFLEEALRLSPKNFDAHNIAAQICKRLQTIDQAIAHLDQALKLKPDDARTIERMLSYEIDALKQDPLRSTEQHEKLLGRMLEVMQKALVKSPKSPAARLDYARFAILAERFDEAITILQGLAQDAPGWTAPRGMLLRIAQLRNDNAGVLHWYARMQPEEIDERAVVAAVKAKRSLGEVEQAQELLAAHLDRDWPALRREYVRNLFFGARFEEAGQEAARMLEQHRNDLEMRFLAAAANLELGQNELAFFHAAWIQMHGGARLYPLEMPLFLYAALHRCGDAKGALAQLDPMFARVGAQTVGIDPRLGAETFDQLCGTGAYPAACGPHAPVFEGPKVSVVMTTYNVRDYVRTAVRSILQQSYRNLELIIVDDASNDGTPAILTELERSDPRIKLILKSTNDGTYVSKNLGLLQAQGEFAAFQDSDDWSHPDRLACSIGVLLRNPEIVGLTTDWLRMTTSGDIVIKAGGQISHLCCISLVFRRGPVMSRIGFFDSVRIAADLELIQRIGLVFGAKRVPRLRWPLLFGRARSDSLTASEEFGLSRTGFTEPREFYHRNADAFHEQVAAGASAYMPFPLRQRLFEAPAIILPAKTTA